jgi:hypothetical protein
MLHFQMTRLQGKNYQTQQGRLLLLIQLLLLPLAVSLSFARPTQVACLSIALAPIIGIV